MTRREYPLDPAVHAEVYGEEPPPGAGTDTGTSTATAAGTGGTTSPTPAQRPADDRGHGTAVLTHIADVLDRTDLPALFLAFLMTLTLRAAQGSTTAARAALGPVVRLSAR